MTQAIIIVIGGISALALVALAALMVRRHFAGRLRAEAELDRFFSLSLDMLCIAGMDGYFKRVSPGVTEMLGWSVEEFLTQPYLDLIHPDDRDISLREVEKQASGQKVLRFEHRFLHKNGSWRVLSWRSVPQPNGMMYAIARDVTELKRRDEALVALKDQLELRVQERTAELLQTTQSLEAEVVERRQTQQKLQSQMERLSLPQKITQAIGERQDLRSILQVMLGALEDHLPVEFGCVCLYEPSVNF